MKALNTLLFIFLLITADILYSQSDSTNSKWSFGMYGGVFVPTYDYIFRYSFGPNLTFKVEYNLSNKTSLYLRSEYSYIRGLNDFIFIVDEVPKVYARCIATTFGIKYRPFNLFKGFYTQLGIGDYYLEKQFPEVDKKLILKKLSNNIGFNIGTGYEIHINKFVKIDFGSFYNLVNDREAEASTYFSFYSGIDFKL